MRTSLIDVLGVIWMPPVPAASQLTLTNHDVDTIRMHGEGRITRESVQSWLDTHAADFQSITDFCASIESGNDTIDIPWDSEDNEMTYGDLMCSSEEW